MFSKLKFAVMVALAAMPVCSHATDLAVLRNGNSIRHERREVVGAVTRLYLSDSASGYVEVPSDQIERFETDSAPAPALSNSTKTPEAARHSLPTSHAQTTASAANPALDRASLNLVVSGAGQRHQIDPDFINSVIRAESGFNNRAVSKKGAQGLMQLMPGTASQLGVTNSFDPNSNVEGGTKYLRALLEKYNYDVPKALAAYNAGSRRVDQYRGVPPYFETQTYVAKIIRDYNRKKLAENPSLAHKGKAAGRNESQSAKSIHKTRSEKRSASTALNSAPPSVETVSR